MAGRDYSVLDFDSGKGENNEEFRFADKDDIPLLKTQTRKWTMWFVTEYKNTCICGSEVRTLYKSCLLRIEFNLSLRSLHGIISVCYINIYILHQYIS